MEKDKETQQTAGAGADDFFRNTDAEMSDFVKHMSRPVEEIDSPPIDLDAPTEGAEAAVNGGLSEGDREMLSHFDYNEGHLKSAEFTLIQVDKAFAFGFSLISGQDMQKYRLRAVKPKGDDYEAEILAALFKKYQLEMSLEWMFVAALTFAYGPMLKVAFDDKAEAAKKALRQKESAPDADGPRTTGTHRQQPQPL